MTTATVHPTQGVADHARDPVTATPGLSAIKLSVGGKGLGSCPQYTHTHETTTYFAIKQLKHVLLVLLVGTNPGKEVVYVGTMDPKTMTMQDLVALF